MAERRTPDLAPLSQHSHNLLGSHHANVDHGDVHDTHLRRRSLGRPICGAYLLVGSAAIVAYFLLPTGGVAQASVDVAVLGSLVVVLAVGVRMYRPARTLVWRVFLAAHVLALGATTIWYCYPVLKGVEVAFPSWADPLYILSYSVIAAGLVLLIRARNTRHNRADLIDASILAVALGTVLWVFQIQRTLNVTNLPPLATFFTVSYPLLDLVLLALALRLVVGAGRREPAFWLVLGAVVAQLSGDIGYAESALRGTFHFGSPLFACWMIAYLLLGAAALHPSMCELTARSGEPRRTTPRHRLPLLAVAALTAPVILLVQHERGASVNVPLLVATTVVTFLLVIARLADLISEHEVVQQELAATRDSALEASRLKSQFLATMSHEIRTPMNGVVGLTDLLLATDLDGHQRRYAEGVQNAGGALLSVINDILDFSKIEAGRLELETTDFNLVTVVEEAGALVAEQARGKGLELLCFSCPDLPTHLRGDPGRIRQVLINLASNAVKFTAHGEVVIRAELVEETAERVTVRFKVVDTGIGVADADQARLFEPFCQADASTTRRFGGTGLGLAICSQLVNAMGGELGLTSTPGEGSTFWFTIPLLLSTGEALEEQTKPDLLNDLTVLVVDDNETNRLMLQPPSPSPSRRPEQLRGHILIVDDNAINQMVAEGILVGLHYRTQLAANGLEALHALSQHDFSAVLMDCQMPEMDGFEATAEIRRREGAHRHTPIIAMTAGALEGDREACLIAGMDDYIAKPIKTKAMEAALSRWTAAANSGRPGARAMPWRPVGQHASGHQGGEERLGGWGSETETRDPLPGDMDGTADLVVGVGSGDRVAADSLHLQEVRLDRSLQTPTGSLPGPTAATTPPRRARAKPR